MRTLPLITLLGLAACGGTTPPGPGPDPSNEVSVGTGAQGGSGPFVPLEDGVELTLEPGAQGGFHVYIDVQVDEAAVAGMGERPLVKRVARRDPAGDLVSRSERTHVFIPSATAGKVELEGVVPLFLCPTPIGIPVADETIELEVEISKDAETPGVKGTLRFIPRCPEGDQAEFCRNICFG
ncbi:MAG: hypothetical protein H6730_27275 [Deltaproteobacteria bacterium]|nr:hypothetical protein [Deltaproteobacteria bacterium]